MPATYEPIASTTLSTANTTITFNSIPSTYTDLKVILISKGTAANQSRWIRFNSDSATNYSATYIGGSGTAVTSADQLNTTFIDPTQGIGTSTTYPIMFAWDIFSYAGSRLKPCLYSMNGDLSSSGSSFRGTGIWASTAAITSITLGMSGTGSMEIGTMATIYGIKAA